MREVIASYPQPLTLGRRGEYGATQVVFDLTEHIKTYGDGVATLIVKRPGDPVEYPVMPVRTEHTALWEIDAAWTQTDGQGWCQLNWYVDDVLAKTTKYKTFVGEAAGASEAPEPQMGYLDQVLAAGAQAVKAEKGASDALKEVNALSRRFDSVASETMKNIEQAAAEAEGYTLHPPIIGENGNWWAWDGTQYVDTGKPSKGEDGVDGSDGNTPQKGVDYYTEVDKQEMVAAVLAALPNAEEVAY